ncbi:hypothetical protein [Brasilonema sp. UFV-L1]|uniref:hypothetical protein n=1 Tax=Brasilonema sp. UFV-L1 TaxID=2234130 RepID=UPI001B7CFA76|nr:hypothetical protein [Brasilonema sp. UFV-L1]
MKKSRVRLYVAEEFVSATLARFQGNRAATFIAVERKDALWGFAERSALKGDFPLKGNLTAVRCVRPSDGVTLLEKQRPVPGLLRDRFPERSELWAVIILLNNPHHT